MGWGAVNFRVFAISLGNFVAVCVSVTAASLRVGSASWLSWGQLALMFCIIASVDAVLFVYSKMREYKNAKVRITEINLTMFATLIFTLLAARAFHVYNSHEAEADFVKYGLPVDVNSFTTIPQALASMRIQGFCELIFSSMLLLSYFWIANIYAVWLVWHKLGNDATLSELAKATEMNHGKKKKKKSRGAELGGDDSTNDDNDNDNDDEDDGNTYY